MRDHTEQILRLICFALGALILFDILRAGYRANPFARLRLPPVPTLQTNAVTDAVANGGNPSNNSAEVGKVTNATSADARAATNSLAGETNKLSVSSETNGTAKTKLTAGTTNIVTVTNLVAAAANAVVKTNPAVATSTNAAAMTKTVVSGSTNTLAVTNTVAVESNNIFSSTNKVAMAGTKATALTNQIVAGSTNFLTATNQVGAASTNGAATNIAHSANPNSMPPGRHGGGMPFAGGMPGMPGMGGPAVPLPKDIQARVDKIVDSEIFAPVMRPLPMQLFGIAGDTAMLRTDSGQSGLVKEGDSLGDVKLVRIGINRVLVEQKGNLKELMIFDGYGGESLMPKTNTISK
jgi:hypothetical protein